MKAVLRHDISSTILKTEIDHMYIRTINGYDKASKKLQLLRKKSKDISPNCSARNVETASHKSDPAHFRGFQGGPQFEIEHSLKFPMNVSSRPIIERNGQGEGISALLPTHSLHWIAAHLQVGRQRIRAVLDAQCADSWAHLRGMKGNEISGKIGGVRGVDCRDRCISWSNLDRLR
jgi:hypothetical protein